MIHTNQSFDVIIIGGGHAGVEAAYAAARMGSKTALITLRKDRIGWMPCNPAIGGIGKGHIVFEVSAFGGLMPQLCTKTYLQAKMLNTRKGPAVQGLRLQIDKLEYAKAAQAAIEATPNLTIIEDMVDEVLLDGSRAVTGVLCSSGAKFDASCVILTSGTFLNGLVHIGKESHAAGRRDEKAVVKLAEFMKSLDLKMGRMKTGTPPRLERSSITLDILEEDTSDKNLEYLFEFEPHAVEHKMSCYITYTNPVAHQAVFEYADQSPFFSKTIKGTPPRYCPSIEDKVTRFAHKDAHQIFIEPEGASCSQVYPSGISTCMPKIAQEKFIRSIKGFENAVFAHYGYAIEYDFVLPHQLNHTLELKTVPGFFLAGQINGTTGYEEAAGQGMIAGINAALKAQGRDPYIMSRNEGYIGIMIDDLVTLGVDEPYRMFTSRAERRLILRQDNVFARLTPAAYELGLVDKARFDAVNHETALVESMLKNLEKSGEIKEMFKTISAGDSDSVKDRITALAAERAATTGEQISQRVQAMVFAEVLYGPYKQRELREIKKNELHRNLMIPANFDYKDLPGLSRELQEKLKKHAPQTVAQAGLIQGMTPAAISLLIFKIREISH